MPTEQNPILNNPYEEPIWHYATNLQGELDYSRPVKGRRVFTPEVQTIPVRQGVQGDLLELSEIAAAEHGNHVVNLLRREVAAWRGSKYPQTTRITRELLQFWFLNPERDSTQSLFFAQREAIETAIWLNEVAEKSNFGQHILRQLEEARKVSASPENNLPRIAFKMATGAGKTVVMAALIAYHYFNRAEYRNDVRFADNFLVIAPGITIRDRLGVLRVDVRAGVDAEDYYYVRYLVPQAWRKEMPELNKRLVITNYHAFEPKTLQGNKRSPFDGKIQADGTKQEATEDYSQVIGRLLGNFRPGSRLLVINDEAHHCYLPREDDQKAEGEDADEENRRAAVWFSGLVRITQRFKVRSIYDLSATPYYLTGSGYEPYSLFKWVVSDFGLIEAVESGLVKIPFLPTRDDTQEIALPVLRNLYEHIRDGLPKAGRKTAKARAKAEGKKFVEEPPRLPEILQAALKQFYEHYQDEYENRRHSAAASGTDQLLFEDSPPVFIVVCNNCSVSKEVYKYLAGYEIPAEDESQPPQIVSGRYELFSNYDPVSNQARNKPPTLLIDSDALENSGQIDDEFKRVFAPEIKRFKEEYARVHGQGAAERIEDGAILREVVNTVGKRNALGAHIRCVVSVSMLTEGWDANTVTHICGIRKFGSQLLCEQVAGRALRRQSYYLQGYDKNGEPTTDKRRIATWKFPPEYAHRTVKDGDDDSLSGEPEQVKAFRDTWELGIHSYLSYLRERLLVARALLHESGSCFVQISDENVHLVRNLMDEVFGSENFVSLIPFRKKTMPLGTNFIEQMSDFILWYGKKTFSDNGRPNTKYRRLYSIKSVEGEFHHCWYELPDGTRNRMSKAQLYNHALLPPSARVYRLKSLEPSGPMKSGMFDYEFEDQTYPAPKNGYGTTKEGLDRLAAAKRLQPEGNRLCFIMYADESSASAITAPWTDTVGADDKSYIVQTNTEVLQRCILMTTDPGDLVLDPTCGSGTTAYVAEQWGRRWITTDTSRIAVNIAKTRLMTATFPYYVLYDSEEGRRHAVPMNRAVGATIGGGDEPGALPQAGMTSAVGASAGSISIGLGATRSAKGASHTSPGQRPGSVPENRPSAESASHAGGAPQCDLRQGFIYKRVLHITLGSIANNEPPEQETLYDQPLEDKKRLRVAGPFTVETLQSYEPISPEEMARQRTDDKELGNFEDLIFAHLKSAGVKTGVKEENAVFVRIDRLANSALHAEGWYPAQSGRADLPVGPDSPALASKAKRAGGSASANVAPLADGEDGDAQQRVPTTMVEKKAYLHIGPKFGTVSKQAVTEAIKACRDKRDGDWLLILGFAFETGITELSRSFGNFQVSIVRMHDDLLQVGLLKKDKKAASFVTIGEPDIRLSFGVPASAGSEDPDRLKAGLQTATVEIAGLDIYDPIKDEVKSRDVHDIAYWMVDDTYDGSNFVVRQVFFCGGDKDEFDEWKKGLSDLAKAAAKKKAEQTLKIQIDDDAFARIYGHQSHPFPVKPGQKVAVRVISQFGEETTKVLEVK